MNRWSGARADPTLLRAGPAVLALSLTALPGAAVPQQADGDDCGTSTGNAALIDLGDELYLEQAGGLYAGGHNAPSEAHLAAALAQAGQVLPRDASGAPDPARGMIGLVAVGLSTTAHEFGRFERDADRDPDRSARVVLVNGAQAGKSADLIADPAAPYWGELVERVRAAGLTTEQVQVAWIKQRRAPGYVRRTRSQPAGRGSSGGKADRAFPRHAELLRDELGAIARQLRARFPNLAIAYLSDRAYGGYSSAEPASYELGFAVKWVIERQSEGDPELNWDPAKGEVRAPLLLWGPYLWADGSRANSAGLRWCREDFELDHGGHPSPSGERKVAERLAAFLEGDATAAGWYLRGPGPGPIALEAVADATVDAAEPDRSFGSEPLLRSSHGDEPALAYVRFDLSGIERPVLHAKLSFRVPTDYVPLGSAEVFAVGDDSWDEATLTFGQAPELGAHLGTLPRVSRDGTRSLAVTEAVNACADGQLTLALALPEPPEVTKRTSRVHARESGDGPRLILAPRD